MHLRKGHAEEQLESAPESPPDAVAPAQAHGATRGRAPLACKLPTHRGRTVPTMASPQRLENILEYCGGQDAPLECSALTTWSGVEWSGVGALLRLGQFALGTGKGSPAP